MIVLLAAGIGVSVLGLLAIGFGIPISDTSFGNALLIAGVVILCTGIVLIGMWLAVREVAKLVSAQPGQSVRVAPASKALPLNPFAAPAADPLVVAPADPPSASASPLPWANEVASRAKPRAPAPEMPPAEPVEAPLASPPAPDRPARRNLLFTTKRRDKAESEPSAPRPTALEAEPKVSFENAWPSPARTNGAADRGEPVAVTAEASANGADAASATDTTNDPPGAIKTPLPDGVTVVRSGTVDELAYTYYSDGSIEAQIAGEKPIRFASLDALRSYVAERK